MPVSGAQLPLIPDTELPAIEARDNDGNPLPRPVCPCCGDQFDAEEGIVPDNADEAHCPDCVHTCDNCNVTTTDEDEIQSARSAGHRRSDDVCLCSSCRQTCADCSSHFANDADGGRNGDGDWICDRCSEHYHTCEDCSETIHEDVQRYHEGRGVSLCESCYDACEDEEQAEDEDDPAPAHSRIEPHRLIHGYKYKPAPTFLAIDGDARPGISCVYFGLEIELENISSLPLRDVLTNAGVPAQSAWYAKADGSLSPENGVELVSHPGTWRYWQAAQFDLFVKLRAARCRSYDTTSCGMHVHISRSAFTELGVWKLLEFFRRNESLIARLSRRARQNLDQWARVNGGPGGPGYRPSRKLLRPDGTKRTWEHDNRYAAINLENANTVEIRIFRGTLDVPALKRNIALCAALTEFVRYTGIRELESRHFVRWLKQYGKRTIGEPEATALIQWVTAQATADSSESGA